MRSNTRPMKSDKERNHVLFCKSVKILMWPHVESPLFVVAQFDHNSALFGADHPWGKAQGWTVCCIHALYYVISIFQHVGPWFEDIWIFLWKQISYKRCTPNNLRKGPLVAKNYRVFIEVFPSNRILHSGHCPGWCNSGGRSGGVDQEQQHTMWQVEWQWPRERAFSHPDPPVTPSSCPRSWDAWREKSAPTLLTRSTPTHSSCSMNRLQSKAGSSSAKQARPSECDTGLQIAAAESYWIMAYFTGSNAKPQTIQKRYAGGHQTFAMK